jgi:exodeoxyribonuclease V alpha subunit
MNQDFFRVTSCQHHSFKYTIFSGVPLTADSYRVNSGKYIVTVKCESDSLPIQPSIGQQWRVRGLRQLKTIQSGDYELQEHLYQAPQRMECTLPETGEALIRFIASERDFSGIGESKARELWEALGSALHKILASDVPCHRKRLRELLSEVSVNALYAGYAKYRNLAHANWMASIGIPLSIQHRMLKYHDERTVELIRTNPYALLGFGMQFKDIDKIASGLGFSIADPVRLSASVEHAIRKQVESGHTYSTHQTLKPMVTKLLGDSALVSKAFGNGYQNAQFMLHPELGTYHPTAQYIMESVVANRLMALAATPDVDEAVFEALTSAVLELPYDLTDRQLEAVESSLTHAISCITGSAGTGKTTVLRTVLKAYESLGYEIHAVALSGRAAMRLHESIGFFTMTIARLLREEPISPSLDQPKHLLIIDEASMIDLPTMYQIVTHLHPSVRIIFTGDPNQLPPIGCGKVLSDLVESDEVATVELNIVKRQEDSTGIPEYSATINRGEVPPSLSVGAIAFHEAPPDQLVEKCKSLYADSPRNTQIIGATKALISKLNVECQKLINPDGERLQFRLHGEDYFVDLRLGDPILFTKNNYNIGIQNGALGILSSTKRGYEDEQETFGVVTLDTGEAIPINEEVLGCMELGYAITLHKAQGSQFPRIIVAIKMGRISDRAWLYTAVTRAEAEIHIVGQAKEFAAIVKSESNNNRRASFLRLLLESRKRDSGFG